MHRCLRIGISVIHILAVGLLAGVEAYNTANGRLQSPVVATFAFIFDVALFGYGSYFFAVRLEHMSNAAYKKTVQHHSALTSLWSAIKVSQQVVHYFDGGLPFTSRMWITAGAAAVMLLMSFVMLVAASSTRAAPKEPHHTGRAKHHHVALHTLIVLAALALLSVVIIWDWVTNGVGYLISAIISYGFSLVLSFIRSFIYGAPAFHLTLRSKHAHHTLEAATINSLAATAAIPLHVLVAVRGFQMGAVWFVPVSAAAMVLFEIIVIIESIVRYRMSKKEEKVHVGSMESLPSETAPLVSPAASPPPPAYHSAGYGAPTHGSLYAQQQQQQQPPQYYSQSNVGHVQYAPAATPVTPSAPPALYDQKGTGDFR